MNITEETLNKGTSMKIARRMLGVGSFFFISLTIGASRLIEAEMDLPRPLVG